MPRVVTCVVEHAGKILVLRRSQSVRTYKGLWGGVAGYIETGEEPLHTAVKELREEVGLVPQQVRLLWSGETISFSDVDGGVQYDWVIYPFFFHANDIGSLRIDWEHTEYRWIDPKAIRSLDTVPHFAETVEKILEEWRMGKGGDAVRKREEKD